eukprot:CAMPEP_0172720742 /NCGR_PEP_ID=MMETSP1074-20121228/77558_1 /TAXON_ID=2916 /ORGANISM="Ceratium fusus, Strain PA161109" /LENGTH=409 /DNA_ID=CAMNT_0013546313 /DNA_START=66 /DNA_END=1292 /DNA_ORIENTATION=+
MSSTRRGSVPLDIAGLHQRRLNKLFTLYETLQWEVSTLKQILSDVKVFSGEAFAVKLHRHRFEQYRKASGWTSQASLRDVLGDAAGAGDYDAFGILPYAGQRAVQKLRTTSRSAQAAPGAIAGKFYVMGGITNGGEVQLGGHRFEFGHGRWETVPKLNVPRCFSPAALLGGDLYFCGTAELGSRSAERFNPSTGKWQMVPPMKLSRHGHALVALGGKLYACGGWSQDDKTMQHVERFNPKSTLKGSWETLQPMLRNRGHAAAGALRGKLLICGGYATGSSDDAGECLDCTELYDPAKEIWESGPRMLEQRTCAAGAALNDLFYVCGGESPPGTVLSSMEMLVPGSGYWSALPPMILRRKQHAVATAVGCIYVAGGTQVTGLTIEAHEPGFPDEFRERSVECYNAQTATW